MILVCRGQNKPAYIAVRIVFTDEFHAFFETVAAGRTWIGIIIGRRVDDPIKERIEFGIGCILVLLVVPRIHPASRTVATLIVARRNICSGPDACDGKPPAVRAFLRANVRESDPSN